MMKVGVGIDVKLIKDELRYREASPADPAQITSYYPRRKLLGFEVRDVKLVATTRVVITPEDTEHPLPHELDGERRTISGRLRHGWKRGLGFISEDGVSRYTGELVLEVHDDEGGAKGFLSHHRGYGDEPEAIYVVINLPRERMDWLWARWLERPRQGLGLLLEFEAWQEASEGSYAEFEHWQFFYIEPQTAHAFDGGRTDLSAFSFTVEPADEADPPKETMPPPTAAEALPAPKPSRRIEGLLWTITALLSLVLLTQCH